MRKTVLVLLLAPVLVSAQSYTLKRDAFVAAGGRAASAHYKAVTAAGLPALSGMESASFSVGPATTVERVEEQLPEQFALLQNYPNPFNQTTTLTWHLPAPSQVRVALYSIRGEEVALLYAGRQQAGVYRMSCAGEDGTGRPLPSGVYFLHLTAGALRRSVKMTILR